jgi:hypothetical protein
VDSPGLLALSKAKDTTGEGGCRGMLRVGKYGSGTHVNVLYLRKQRWIWYVKVP